MYGSYVNILFMGKPDIICIRCKPEVCKCPKNSMDVNYMHPEIKDQGTIVIHTMFWKFTNLWLTSPSGPIRYSILSQLQYLMESPVNLWWYLLFWKEINPFELLSWTWKYLCTVPFKADIKEIWRNMEFLLNDLFQSHQSHLLPPDNVKLSHKARENCPIEDKR